MHPLERDRFTVWSQCRHRGFHPVEILLVVVLVGVIVAACIVSLRGFRSTQFRDNDATQVAHLHHAWAVWSQQAGGRFPTPSAIERSVPSAPAAKAGGAEDRTKNSHAAMYSACIAAFYFNPSTCVSPAEASSHVSAMTTYNFNAYNALQGSFWDPAFQCDLATTSHVSYGTLDLFGARFDAQWRLSLDPRFIVVGNRGVRDGSNDPAIAGQSVTLGIHGAADAWEGNLVFNDGHVEYTSTFTPAALPVFGTKASPVADNIFKADAEGNGGDVWLTMIRRVTLDGNGEPSAERSWD